MRNEFFQERFVWSQVSRIVRKYVCLAVCIAGLISVRVEAQVEPKVQSPAAVDSSSVVFVIPVPRDVQMQEGHFELKSDTVVVTGKETRGEAEYLVSVIAPATGFQIPIQQDASATQNPKTNSIVLKLDPSLKELGSEGYRLSVEKDRVIASAATSTGIFYAIQTLRQLLPPEILKSESATGVKWVAPCVTIEDVPRFQWRGQLFDCCRHFFDLDTVKRQIDLLALHKVNRLHWHLTEDQGWRIEIKKYPKLTEIGAWRTEKDGTRYGGFYTQDQVREVVKYAADRHILVVPEIEMPGHATAALASYPELGCTGGPYEVTYRWGVFDDVYCAGKDEVFQFQEDVLMEVMDLFPSPYIHIGGDECPKTRWSACPKCQARIKAEGLKDEHELQSYFIKRIDTFLNTKGRRSIGWDEILEGGLAENAVVQSWRGVKGGVAAASEGHDVIMSPTSHCYLDYSYSTTPVEKSYSYEPIPEDLAPDKEHHVLGVEGNMWTERVPDQDRLDFQVFPRMAALAEVGWSPKEKRDWNDFSKRMDVHTKRFEMLGVKYGFDEMGDFLSNSKVIGNWVGSQMSLDGVTLDWDVSEFIAEKGNYEAIFLYTHGKAAIEVDWAALLEDGKELQRDSHDAWSGVDKRNINYKFSLEERKPGAKYTVRAHLWSVGGTESNGEVRMRKTK